jgi:hypothetical protein
METAMFCPQCRCEYRPGFQQCANCQVPLVEELPPLPPVPWELDRRDSLNIAFIKGAFIGMACGQLVAFVATQLVRMYLLPTPSPTFTIPWSYQLAHAIIPVLTPLGILVGGFVGRNYRR